MSQMNLPAQTVARLRHTASRLLAQKGSIQLDGTDPFNVLQPQQHVNLVMCLKEHQDVLKEGDRNPKTKRSTERTVTLQVRRYKKYTSEFKQKVVKQLREEIAQSGKPLSRCINQKAKAYAIPLKNVRRWLDTKNFNASGSSLGKKVRFPGLEDKLESQILVNPQMSRGILNADSSVSEEKKSKFAFSNGWYQKFRLRHRSLFERKKKGVGRQSDEFYFENTISDMLQV